MINYQEQQKKLELLLNKFNGTDVDQQVKESSEKTENIAVVMPMDEISKKSIKSKTRRKGLKKSTQKYEQIQEETPTL